MNKIDDLTKGPSPDDKQLKEAQGIRKEERNEFEPAEANLCRDAEHAGTGHRYLGKGDARLPHGRRSVEGQ